MKTTKNKTTKVTAAAAVQEEDECGVWLDTAELRRKKEQKQLKRPIYKLLNPLARSVGYSSAVALSFTQTKMQMPATRQSTISTFFAPQRKASDGKEESSSACPVVMSSTPLPESPMGTKRKREMSFDCPSQLDKLTGHISQVHTQDSDANLQGDSDEVCEDQRKEQHFVHLIWGYQSEEPEPAEKRRPDVIENVTETQDSNKAVVHRCPTTDVVEDVPETLIERNQQDCPEHYNKMRVSIFKDKSHGSSQSPSAKELEPLRPRVLKQKNNVPHKPVLTMRSATENQHPVKHHLKPNKEQDLGEQRWNNTKQSPMKRQGKENHRSTSPTHCGELVFPKHSPAKILSDIKVKCIRSPKKPAKEPRENERDSFAMLFTQDSEGFRVIANRNHETRCPLIDRTNSDEGKDYLNIPSERSVETESSDLESEMLFTQDSQGNMVIRH